MPYTPPTKVISSPATESVAPYFGFMATRPTPSAPTASDIVVQAISSTKVPVSLRLDLGMNSNHQRTTASPLAAYVPFPITEQAVQLPSGPLSTVMIRKKSGELVKPSLKHTSSYPFVSSNSAPASPGGTFMSLDSSSSISSAASTSSLGTIMPQTPSKMVHFDAHLEHVKLFSSEQKPAAVSRDGSPEPTTTDTENEVEYFGFKAAVARRFRHSSSANKGKEPEDPRSLANRVQADFVNFLPATSASTQPPPLPRLEHVRLVSLELCATDSKTVESPGSAGRLFLNGTVVVRNLAFDKWLAIRFTLDDWQTVSEVSGKWVRSVRMDGKEDNGDLFSFSIKLADHLHRIASKTLVFCIRYRVPDHEWWDNNGGSNYVIKFHLRPLPVVAAQSSPIEGLPSSPEPEDLRKRLEKLNGSSSKHSRPRVLVSLKSEATVGFSVDDDDGDDTAAPMIVLKSARSRTSSSGSTVPFPTQEKEANTSAWLRSQEVVQPIPRSKDQRRSYTFPDTFRKPTFDNFSVPAPATKSASFTTTAFSVGAFVQQPHGTPRDPIVTVSENRRQTRISLETPPLFMTSTSTSGPEKDKLPRRRHHQRSSYFDTWQPSASTSEMIKSPVKLTPPGSPLDAKKTLPSEEEDQNQDQDQDQDPDPPVSASSSSNETVTLEDHLQLPSAEPEPEPEPEPETPSLASAGSGSVDSTNASSPSEEMSGDEILMMKNSSSKGYQSLQGLFSVMNDQQEELGSMRDSPPFVDEEQRRQYSAFVDQFCFFTGGIGDMKHQSISPPTSRMMIAQAVSSSPGMLSPPTPRRTSSDTSVDTMKTVNVLSPRLVSSSPWPSPQRFVPVDMDIRHSIIAHTV